ncbi:MAG: sigma-70 family RNA polymerase sigma factor [Lentisphaeraceae bacterium]|nr:sigma-70 family RNA polymerase sigma factor [Lentisphaeraceae bacterium]
MENFNTRQTLISKIRNQHDDRSWEEFVYFYERYIFVVINKMGVNYQDCEDLVQKVLLVLWEKLPEFEYIPDKCKFRTWMNSIIRNVVVGFFRKSKRQRNDLERASLQKLNENPNEFDIPEIYDLAESEWKLHIANLAWENIKDEFTGKAGDCFMRFSEGKTVDEICIDLDIKKNTAYVFRSRVQEKLHREIRRLDAELS